MVKHSRPTLSTNALKTLKTESLQRLRVLEEAVLKRTGIANSFWEFVKYIHPHFKASPYIESDFAKEVCDNCQAFYEDVVAGKRPQKGLFAPPQHGKSLLISRYFPAWAFGKNPRLNIAGCSYDGDLASGVSRDISRIMKLPQYISLFGRLTGIPGLVDNTTGFETAYGGRYLAVGIGGGFTGKPADIGIIDDPHKERPSKTERDRVFEWYNSIFSTRVSANSGRMLMMTRWDVDDLAGRVQGQGWDFHVYPAINKDGKALTDFKPLDFLLAQKKQFSAYQWASMYQQEPYPLGGNLIKSEWFQYYEGKPNCDYIYTVADTNIAGKTSSDYFVAGTFGINKNGDYYILDWHRKQATFPEMKRTLSMTYEKWRLTKKYVSLYLEAAASGTQLIDVFKEERIPARAVKPIGSKYFRLSLILWKIENGYLHLPKDAPWLLDFIAECEAFSADGKQPHDDQVDVLAYAMGDQCEIKRNKIKFGAEVINTLRPMQ